MLERFERTTGGGFRRCEPDAARGVVEVPVDALLRREFHRSPSCLHPASEHPRWRQLRASYVKSSGN